MMNSLIRVLVVNDHPLERRGLATLLLDFDDLALAGEARNGAEALELCATTCPDVIMMDLLMPELDGAEATRIICERYPTVQVIALTTFDEYALLQRALSAGASGILLKNMSSDELAANIRRVHAERQPQAPKSFEEMMRTVPLPALPLLPKVDADLTEREIEVLALMVQGMTNVQIGEALIISRATAKFHVSSILGKLGVTTRTEAVALAVRSGLTTGPG